MPCLDDIAWVEKGDDSKEDLRQEEDCASGSGNPAHHLKTADCVAQDTLVALTGKDRNPVRWTAMNRVREVLAKANGAGGRSISPTIRLHAGCVCKTGHHASEPNGSDNKHPDCASRSSVGQRKRARHDGIRPRCSQRDGEPD